MSNSLRPVGNTTPATGGAAAPVNLFAQVSAVAKPTLDTVLKLNGATKLLAELRKSDSKPFLLDINAGDCDAAEARLGIIPDKTTLQQAVLLFDEAVRKPAPEPWYHYALGAMLAAMPNAKNVASDYSYAIVDMIMYDPASWQGYGPGFSPPVFITAIRKIRREEEFVPSAAKLLETCQRCRKQFIELKADAESLIRLRENAEEILADADEWTAPCELPPRTGPSTYVEIPDEDLPF